MADVREMQEVRWDQLCVLAVRGDQGCRELNMRATAGMDTIRATVADRLAMVVQVTDAVAMVVVTDGLIMAVHRVMKVRWVETYMDTAPDLDLDLGLGLGLGLVMVDEDMTGASEGATTWGPWTRRGGGAGSSPSYSMYVLRSRGGRGWTRSCDKDDNVRVRALVTDDRGYGLYDRGVLPGIAGG